MLERLATAILKAEHQNRAAKVALPTLAQIEQDVDNELAAGTLSGKLTARETQALRDQYAQLTGKLKTVNDAATAIGAARDLTKLLAETKKTENNGVTALPDVDKREAELNQQIVDGLMQGRLSEAEADGLQGELKRIEISEGAYRKEGGFSLGEQASLTLELEKVAHAIEEKLHDVQISQPDVDVSRSYVDSLLAHAVDEGKLTVAECATFSQALDDIARGETSYRFSGNGLSYTESLALQAQLDKLVAKIRDAIKARRESGEVAVSLDSDIKNTEAKIIASTKIDAAGRARLRREVEHIIAEKMTFAASNGALNLTEVSSVVRDLDRLKANLSGRLGQGDVHLMAWTDVESRSLRLAGALNRGIATGKLKTNDSIKARRELSIFKAMEARMKGQAKDKLTLSYPQQITLARQLDKIVKIIRPTVTNAQVTALESGTAADAGVKHSAFQP